MYSQPVEITIVLGKSVLTTKTHWVIWLQIKYIKKKVYREWVDLHSHSFIKIHLGAGDPGPADAEALRLELAELQQKCDMLEEENKELRNKVKDS